MHVLKRYARLWSEMNGHNDSEHAYFKWLWMRNTKLLSQIVGHCCQAGRVSETDDGLGKLLPVVCYWLRDRVEEPEEDWLNSDGYLQDWGGHADRRPC